MQHCNVCKVQQARCKSYQEIKGDLNTHIHFFVFLRAKYQENTTGLMDMQVFFADNPGNKGKE